MSVAGHPMLVTVLGRGAGSFGVPAFCVAVRQEMAMEGLQGYNGPPGIQGEPGGCEFCVSILNEHEIDIPAFYFMRGYRGLQGCECESGIVYVFREKVIRAVLVEDLTSIKELAGHRFGEIVKRVEPTSNWAADDWIDGDGIGPIFHQYALHTNGHPIPVPLWMEEGLVGVWDENEMA